MDTIAHYASKGVTNPERMSSRELLALTPPTPSSPHDPENPNKTSTPEHYKTLLKRARRAFKLDDFLTATNLSYELMADTTVPFWSRAQAALIITSYDAYPGNGPMYAEAVSIVEAVKRMEQEQVCGKYTTMQNKIEGKRIGSISSEEAKKKQKKRVQFDGTGGESEAKAEEQDRIRESKGNSEEAEGRVVGEEGQRARPLRDCGCIVS